MNWRGGLIQVVLAFLAALGVGYVADNRSELPSPLSLILLVVWLAIQADRTLAVVVVRRLRKR